MVEDRSAQPTPYPAEKARGGEIILRKPWQRALFLAGLVIPVALFLLVVLLNR